MFKPVKLFTILTSVLVLLMFSANITAAQESSVRTISVQGNSSLQIPADKATIRIGIENTNDTAEAVIAENNTIANNIQEQLLALGLNKDAIKTSSYNFYPQYNNKQELINYMANNTITVTTENIADCGKIIKTAIDAGANKIDSIVFSAKNDANLQQKALKLAAKDAKNKAQSIAAALDKQIINIVNVSENNVSFHNYRIANFSAKATANEDAAAPPIQPGNIDVEASLSITFEIN